MSDLDTASAVFVLLGLEVEGRTFLEGDFLDTAIGMRNARTEIVLLRPPDGGAGVELATFIRPDHDAGCPQPRPPSWACAACRRRLVAGRID